MATLMLRNFAKVGAYGIQIRTQHQATSKKSGMREGTTMENNPIYRRG